MESLQREGSDGARMDAAEVRTPEEGGSGNGRRGGWRAKGGPGWVEVGGRCDVKANERTAGNRSRHTLSGIYNEVRKLHGMMM